MILSSNDLSDGTPVPPQFVLGTYDAESHVRFSENISPEFHWDDVPSEAASLSLLVVDIDVPTKPDHVNKEGTTVPFELPRGRFYHWCLTGIPVGLSGFKTGEWSTTVTAHGKSETNRSGVIIGRNDYTDWFKGDPDMEGTYYGYDGPCPPWNDERVHRYRFELYALDTASLDLPAGYAGDELMGAMKGHVLDQASFSCTYKIYPHARMP